MNTRNSQPEFRREILLLEDNANTSERQRLAGVSSEHVGSTITVRVHRINGMSTEIAASRTYKAGSFQSRRNGRIDLAIRLLERAEPKRGCIIVAGTSFSSAVSFMESLCAAGLSFVVQVNSGTSLNIVSGARSTAGELLVHAKWESVRSFVPDGTIREFLAAKLVDVELPLGTGKLFAARLGGIESIQRNTIIGLSSFDTNLCELVRMLGYTRWMRPIYRKKARATLGGVERVEPAGKAASLLVRSNITLARQQDERLKDLQIHPQELSLRGRLQGYGASLNVVELFAGAGGMGLGFLLAAGAKGRYRLIFSGEANPIYVQTLRSNHESLKGVLGRIGTELVPEQTRAVDLRLGRALDEIKSIGRERGGVNVVIGGPPCQGFSTANQNSWHPRNPNNLLVDEFLRYVEELRPQVFLMENVQGILWTPKGRSSVSVVDVIERRMRAAGYVVFPKLLDAVWYGVPQHRARFFLVGLHRDLGYDSDSFGEWGPFPMPTHGGGVSGWVTVKEAIGDLPHIGNGASVEELPYSDPLPLVLQENQLLRFIREGAEQGVIYDHITSRHADYVIERYRKIPPGGNWESIRDDLKNYADVSRTHSNIYRRLEWNEPSITIGHYRKSMLVHPNQHRGLSLREAARLQSFPDWFRFAGAANGGSGGLMHKQQQLANAVCPLVTKAIAEFILQL